MTYSRKKYEDTAVRRRGRVLQAAVADIDPGTYVLHGITHYVDVEGAWFAEHPIHGTLVGKSFRNVVSGYLAALTDLGKGTA